MGARATSGHYFTYLYNFKTKKWNRISDEQVNEVTEEEVLKISEGFSPNFFSLSEGSNRLITGGFGCLLGGNNDCCAYSLFYAQDDIEPHGHNEEELRELAKSIDKGLEETVCALHVLLSRIVDLLLLDPLG